MTSQELYFDFHQLLNKNASQKNINIPEANFVRLYNREAEYWLADYIDKNSSTDNIHNIEGLLKLEVPLTMVSSSPQYYEYSLPENYFNFVESKSEAVKNKCTRIIFNYLQKPKEININLEFQHPSFEFEESICNISDKKLRVYVDEYKINNTYLSYYISPQKIDLEGSTDINTGLPTKNVDSDLDSLYQYQILDRVVFEVQREFENNNALNVLQSKINQQ